MRKTFLTQNWRLFLVCTLTLVQSLATAEQSTNSSYSTWKNGPPKDPAFFPIAVWLQPVRAAEQYKQAGINTYVALWNGPTEEQLTALKASGMKLICSQNEVARKHLDDPTIIGWMHGDEPDNAQALPEGKGYGPPIEPARIIEDYKKLRDSDPTRPVMLNLGQGVAWDGWFGRGVRSNHPEDYAEYVKGSDIVSFDIYPVAHPTPEIQGKLWYVAKGVERLVKWTDGKKVVWDCIECTRISENQKATPSQVRTEVWMSLIHGSKGLIYFVHEWKPKFNESALLADPEMLRGVSNINHQIQRLAPVLNSPTLPDLVKVTTSSPDVPIAVMCKQFEGATYVFAVSMRDKAASASFTLPADVKGKVEVIDETRDLSIEQGGFKDSFEPWAVHLYRIK